MPALVNLACASESYAYFSDILQNILELTEKLRVEFTMILNCDIHFQSLSTALFP